MVHCRPLLLLVLAIGVPLSASAQINPFRTSRGTPLNAEDLKELSEATYQLLERPQLTVGDMEAWDNMKSGVAGTVTAGNPRQRKGLACRMTNYVINGPGSERQRKAALTWCKTKDGWKIG